MVQVSTASLIFHLRCRKKVTIQRAAEVPACSHTREEHPFFFSIGSQSDEDIEAKNSKEEIEICCAADDLAANRNCKPVKDKKEYRRQSRSEV